MCDWRLEKLTLATRCEFFWATNSDLYGDVTFLVGPEEERIKGFKILLMVTSPVFEVMFGATWSTARGQDDPIKLPNTDPVVFRHFLRLLLTDSVATRSIDELKLSMRQVLDLFFLAKQYIVQGLQETLDKYIRRNIRVDTVFEIYDQFHDKDEEKLETDSFMFIVTNAPKILQHGDLFKVSKQVLLKIFSNNDLAVDEIDLFNGGHRWAEFQVSTESNFNDDEKKKEKVREILRELLPEIRLPLVTCQDVTLYIEPTGVLTLEELIALFKYTSLNVEKGKSPHGSILQLSSNLSMKTDDRNLLPSSQLLVLSRQIDDPSYIFRPHNNYIWLKASETVKIRGFRFCGPLNRDSEYEVSVHFYNNVTKKYTTGERKFIAANKKTILRFPLTTPVIMEKDTWYRVDHNLKGAPTGCTEDTGEKTEKFRQNGIDFDWQQIGRRILQVQYSRD